MAVYDQRIWVFPPHQITEGAARMVSVGAEQVAAKGGRLFGLFTGVIGLSVNRAVVITEWPDETTAAAWGHLVADGLPEVRQEARETLEPTSRPVQGQSPTDVGGVYTLRTFDILEADWPRFLELSESAWGNFEEVHPSRVAGFWRSQTTLAGGQVRVRLMAWYQDLDAWERSRWWNASAREGSAEAFARFRERSRMLQDTEVSIIARVPLPGETP